MKISVIIPVYNTEKYLKKCLDSIVNQSLKEIEIILINDCSQDNALDIIEKYQKIDNRIILINKTKNEGLTSARNSGLEIANGEYILHIDSDDWIEQDYLKDMYEIATKYNADIVISDFYFDFLGKKIVYQRDQYGVTGTILNNKKVIENLAFGHEEGFPAVWNKLIKKEVYTKNNIKFPLKISIGEDLGTIIFLMYFSKKIVKLERAYLHYIQNPNSMTNKYNFSALKDIYYVLNKINDFFKNKDYDLFLKNLKYNHLSSWIFKVEPRFNNKLYNKILEEYLFLLENKRTEKNNKKLIKYYFICNKIFDSKISFFIIWKLLNFKRKIKVILEK